MNFSRSVSFCLIISMILLASGCLQEKESLPDMEIKPYHGEMLEVLSTMQGAVVQAIIRVGGATGDAAIRLGRSGISGDAADAILEGLAASDPSAVYTYAFDRNGTILAAAPRPFRSLVGERAGDLTGHEGSFDHPVMSGLSLVPDAGYVAVIEYPVYSEDGVVVGGTGIAFSPDRLVAPCAESALRNTPYTAMVAQTDGRILYDPDPEEVGKETFNETLSVEFPEILDFAHQYAEKRSGYSTYSFYDTGFSRVVDTEAFWTTIGAHGQEWRLIIINEI